MGWCLPPLATGHGGRALDQPGRGRDQRRLRAERHPPAPGGRARCATALEARGGRVAEGSVGAGTGTVAFGWKGGIGTSSRRVAAADSVWTVGVLVQSNYGGDLHILGVPVGRALGRDGLHLKGGHQGARGSIMIVDRNRRADRGPQPPPHGRPRDARRRPDGLDGGQRFGRLRRSRSRPIRACAAAGGRRAARRPSWATTPCRRCSRAW